MSHVECANCGTELEHIPGDTSPRAPCPKCGAVARAYTMSVGNMQPSAYLLDNFFAHKLSSLTSCGAPELPDEGKWLNTFILKTIFHFSLADSIRAYLFNFLRRTEGARSAYREARRHLNEHLTSPPNTITPYFRSLLQFEICLSQCYQGYELLAKAAGCKVFEPGTNTQEERLQIAYVDSKHMDQMISGKKLPEGATSGVWITNDGIESSRGMLPFNELHDLLSRMGSLAETLCSMPPAADGKQ